MRIEWLIGEKQFRLDTLERDVNVSVKATPFGYSRTLTAPSGDFILTVPAHAKLWITEGDSHA